MPTDLVTPKPQIKIRGVVRDKYGHPKFSDPSIIVEFIDRLTEEDIEYLTGLYGEEIWQKVS